MKECSGKKVQKITVAQNDPLDSSSQKNWPGGQRDQGHGVVQEEVHWLTLTFRRRVTKYHRVSKRCPKFRNYVVSLGTKHKRGVKSRVKKLSVTRDQNSIFFLEVDPIPFLGLDLIDTRSSFNCVIPSVQLRPQNCLIQPIETDFIPRDDPWSKLIGNLLPFPMMKNTEESHWWDE